jgi:hypothetical protein
MSHLAPIAPKGYSFKEVEQWFASQGLELTLLSVRKSPRPNEPYSQTYSSRMGRITIEDLFTGIFKADLSCYAVWDFGKGNPITYNH